MRAFPDEKHSAYVNSLGIKLIRIHAGSFRIGNNSTTDPAVLKQFAAIQDGDYDKKPAHEVRITYDFYISETEITASQFARFRFDHQDSGRHSPYATGISWHDAVAFTQWLSRIEKKNYRLPTEAEWEYAARAGSSSHFSSGETPPADGEANAWGVKNMHSSAAEWVLDWHGLYPPEPQVDPVGPRSGFARVVRGGGIMSASERYPELDFAIPFHRRSANRASVSSDYRGAHNIGFRIVEGPLPRSAPWEPEIPPPQQFVKQSADYLKAGPDPNKPWFRRRTLLPIPPENAPAEAIQAVGIHPAILGHLHAGGLTVCPNGDVLATWFSASTPATEYLANTTFVLSRLRFGSEEWDMPGPLYDFADVNDQSSLLWTEKGVVHHFSGGAGLTDVPFRMQISRDNGASWEQPRLPLLIQPVGGYYPQPISSMFRGPDGTLYLGSDGVGGESLLWASSDGGRTWFDNGGRTAGRHTVFVRLKDGGILGIGGKNTDIDGYMPQAISRDNGKTWTASRTPFPALGGNQRPSLARLASGRLFFASDWQDRRGRRPAGASQRGAFVALSDDEGRTWKTKTLPGTLPHEAWTLTWRKDQDWTEKYHDDGTIGYSVAAQSPNGVIHLISTMNHPSQHWEMNEAWILSISTEYSAAGGGVGPLLPGKETYPDGKLKASWTGRTDSAGRYLLHGAETWFHPNGAKQYEVTWANGRKAGLETCWTVDGKKAWEWERRPDGGGVWTQYWPNGQTKSRSEWKQGQAHGPAMLRDYMGGRRSEREFRNGELVR